MQLISSSDQGTYCWQFIEQKSIVHLYIYLLISFMISKESELHHSIGSLIDGAHPSPKTDRDYLGRYRLKTFETAKGKKSGAA